VAFTVPMPVVKSQPTPAVKAGWYELSDSESTPTTPVLAFAAVLLRNNLWIYGVGGIIVPFIGIKLTDMLITNVGLA